MRLHKAHMRMLLHKAHMHKAHALGDLVAPGKPIDGAIVVAGYYLR